MINLHQSIKQTSCMHTTMLNNAHKPSNVFLEHWLYSVYKAGTFSILILYLCIFQHIVICLNIQLWTVFCSISCTHFSISHWPPQGAVQAGQIKVPPGYHPIDVEKEWGRLHVSILEREKLLRIEFERWESSGRPQRWNTLSQPLIISQREATIHNSIL